MMNKNMLIGGVVILLIAVLGGWWLWSQNNPVPVVQDTNQNVPTGQTEDDENNEPVLDVDVTVGKTHEIVYSDSGFTPKELSIKKGDTVTFKNQSSVNMWVGSAMHPTHIVYGGKALSDHCPDPENDDFDQCRGEAPGASWSFTFNKAGSWGYHDHLTSSRFGKVIVAE